jgi:hypothetical protein
MKIVSFFSRLAVICNVSFVVYLILKKIESNTSANGNLAVPVPYLKGLIITLGISSVFLNMVMLIWYIILLNAGKKKLIPLWLAVVNILFLLFQCWYYFIRSAAA